MSSKSKNLTNYQWILYSDGVTKFVSKNKDLIINNDVNYLRYIKHGFIIENELLVHVLTDRNIHSNFIHIHPLTMKEFKLTFTTPIILQILKRESRVFYDQEKRFLKYDDENDAKPKIEDMSLSIDDNFVLSSDRSINIIGSSDNYLIEKYNFENIYPNENNIIDKSDLNYADLRIFCFSNIIPDSSLSLSAVKCSNYQVDGEIFGSVKKISDIKCLIANKIIVSCKKWCQMSNIDSENICIITKQFFANKYLSFSTPIEIHYFSQELYLNIIRIYTEDYQGNIIEALDKLKTDQTELVVYMTRDSTIVEIEADKSNQYSSICIGFEKEKYFLNSLIESGINHPIDSKGNCLLLTGQKGSGKMILAKYIISNYKSNCIHFLLLKSSDILMRYKKYNDIQNWIFESLKDNFTVVYFQNISNILTKNEHVDKSFMALSSVVLNSIDKLRNHKNCVLIIASCCDTQDLNSEIFNSNIFQHHIKLEPPTPLHRFQILSELLKNQNCNLSNSDIKEIADNCHGFTPLYLKKLVQLGIENNKNGNLNINDLYSSWRELQRGNVIQSAAVKVPKIYWTDIAGQLLLKQQVQRLIEWPLKYSEKFFSMSIKPAKGLLLYGPPGCSKTMIAKAVATECGLNFFAVKGSELLSKYIGESEKNVRKLFLEARLASPSVIFFDEIDSFCGERNRDGSNATNSMLSTVLTELDGIKELKQVFVLAATNLPQKIDKALLRPGRLCKIVYVPLPDLETRLEILQMQFKKLKCIENVDIQNLALQMEGYSCSEIVNVCQKTARKALSTFFQNLYESKSTRKINNLISLENNISHNLILDRLNASICTKLVESILREQKPLVTKQMIDIYENFALTFNTKINKS